MTTISHYLSGDHKRCDDFFIEAETAAAKSQWEHAFSVFLQFFEATERHFVMEEEVLFPAFEKAVGSSAGPTAVMRSEHAQMRGLLRQMAQALDDKNTDDYLGHSETLNILMQQHNLKEEGMLYLMSDRVLAGRQSELIAAMHDIGAAADVH